MNENQNPFSYGLETYSFVVLLASIAGFVRFLNTTIATKQFHFMLLIRDLLTGILAGLMAFWLCDFFNLIGPLSNVAIVIAGMLGVQAVDEIKHIIFSILQSYVHKK